MLISITTFILPPEIFLKISLNSQENTFAEVSVLIKLESACLRSQLN